jgi:hypothetical protein
MQAKMKQYSSFALLVGLFVCLILPVTTHAQPLATDKGPLDEREQALVIDEIARMLKTRAEHEGSFVVQEATPERIERLFAMPDVLKLPTNMRENGLVFAGQGEMLHFDKPSDVLAKVSAWFPQEFADARAAKNANHFFGHIRLHGPFPHWNAEATAFLGLWNCMPAIAWLKPEANPFMRRSGDSLPLMPVATQSSADQEFDFGFCLQQRSGRIDWGTDLERRANQQGRERMAQQSSVLLRKKFARFLSAAGCTGSGPDDCVLILHLWASLDAGDAELARTIQSLESDIAPDGPLPPVSNETEVRHGRRGGDARPDEALRRAALVRTKLLSVLKNPQSWPPQALAATLRQMTLLQQLFTTEIEPKWRNFGLDHYNRTVSPWSALASNLNVSPQLRPALLAELEQLDKATPCAVWRAWFKHGGEDLESLFALQHILDKSAPACARPGWVWLKQGQSAVADELRGRYLDLLAGLAPPALRETILHNLSDGGKNCFAQDGTPVAAPIWLRTLCASHISEPQQVPFKLQHSRLALTSKNRFRMLSLSPVYAQEDAQAQQHWLAGLLAGRTVGKRMAEIAADLANRKLMVRAARYWFDAGHPQALLELQTNDGSAVFLLVERDAVNLLQVPERFHGNGREQLVHVSDLDGDGRLELWWAEAFSECQGNSSDLAREVDCSAKHAAMGEIHGDTLSYFANTPRARHLKRRAAAPGLSNSMKQVLAPADGARCNRILIGSVLGTVLKIGLGEDDAGQRPMDLIDMACKPHPLHPQKTIVALFYRLPEENNDDSRKRGLAVAVLDMQRGEVDQLHREVIEEEAGIRIDAGSLSIDTGRYTLAKGMRAFGVRMAIGYSPRYADGGENDYLSLFIEEGRRLRPILSQLAMTSWHQVSDAGTCGSIGADCTVENFGLILKVLPGATNGWRDIEVRRRRTPEGRSANADGVTEHLSDSSVIGVLRAKDKKYTMHALPH